MHDTDCRWTGGSAPIWWSYFMSAGGITVVTCACLLHNMCCNRMSDEIFIIYEMCMKRASKFLNELWTAQGRLFEED